MLVPRAARRGLKFVWRFSRFVGAACMRPANLAGVGRCRVGMVCTLHCRAGVHARRTNHFKNNFYNVRQGKRPYFPRTPARWRTPAGRHICLPYKHPGPRTRTKNVAMGRTAAAGSAPAGAFRSATGPQGPALSAQIKTPPYRTGEKRPVPRQNLHIHAGTRPGGAAPGQNRQKTAQIAAAFVRFTPCLLAEMLYNIQHRMNKYSNRACRGRHTKTQRKRNGS